MSMIEPEAFQLTGVASSSPGNIDKLGFLSKLRPSNPNAGLILDHPTLGVRANSQAIVCISYEYDGQLTLHLQGARQWHSDEAWKLFGEAMRAGVQGVTQGAQGLARL
jgi:hypothetical protein